MYFFSFDENTSPRKLRAYFRHNEASTSSNVSQDTLNPAHDFFYLSFDRWRKAIFINAQCLTHDCLQFLEKLGSTRPRYLVNAK